MRRPCLTVRALFLAAASALAFAAPGEASKAQWGPVKGTFTNLADEPCTFKITDCTRAFRFGTNAEGKETVFEESARTDIEALVPARNGRIWIQFQDDQVERSQGEAGTAMFCYSILDKEHKEITTGNVYVYVGEQLRASLERDGKFQPCGGFRGVAEGAPKSLNEHFILQVSAGDPGHLILSDGPAITGSGSAKPTAKL